jgi:hypothetical protein
MPFVLLELCMYQPACASTFLKSQSKRSRLPAAIPAHKRAGYPLQSSSQRTYAQQKGFSLLSLTQQITKALPYQSQSGISHPTLTCAHKLH